MEMGCKKSKRVNVYPVMADNIRHGEEQRRRGHPTMPWITSLTLVIVKVYSFGDGKSKKISLRSCKYRVVLKAFFFLFFSLKNTMFFILPPPSPSF